MLPNSATREQFLAYLPKMAHTVCSRVSLHNFDLVTSGAPRPTYPNQPPGRGCSRANRPPQAAPRPMCSGQGDALGSICPILSPGEQFWAHLPKLANRWHSGVYLPNSATRAHSHAYLPKLGTSGTPRPFCPNQSPGGHYGAYLPNSATREPS